MNIRIHFTPKFIPFIPIYKKAASIRYTKEKTLYVLKISIIQGGSIMKITQSNSHSLAWLQTAFFLVVLIMFGIPCNNSVRSLTIVQAATKPL